MNSNEFLKKIANLKQLCTCLICNKNFTKYSALGFHVKMVHKVEVKKYYDEYLRKDKEGFCKNCGEDSNFESIGKGYKDFCDTNCYKEARKKGLVFNIGNTGKKIHSERFKQRMRENNPVKFRKNAGRKHFSKEERQRMRQHMIKVNNQGFENKGGKCKWYEYKGIKCQGRYELCFLIQNFDRILGRGKRIKTPYGWYTPDFDLGDYFVEIKSTFTLKTSRKSGQLKRIKWTSKNIKRVQIKVLPEVKVENFMKTFS